jgi:hypothetical protein
METITNAIELKEAILQLESDKVEQGILLKEVFFQSILQINPLYRLEEQLSHTYPFSLGGHSFVAKLAGMLSGYLIKKWITGKNGNPIRKVVGSIIQVMATTLISHQSVKLIYLGRFLIHAIFSKAHTEHDND